MSKVKIDLACGNSKEDGFIGVDIFDGPEVDIVHDLNVYPYPFEDNSVDEIYCCHYIEHIKHDNLLGDIKIVMKECSSFEEFKTKILDAPPQPDGMIKFFNEIYRILKPGGKAELRAPYYASMRAYGDPTHVRVIADSTFWYVQRKWREENKLEHYGLVCDFDVNLSYLISEEMTYKAKEVQTRCAKRDWNTVEDLIIELTKNK